MEGLDQGALARFVGSRDEGQATLEVHRKFMVDAVIAYGGEVRCTSRSFRRSAR